MSRQQHTTSHPAGAAEVVAEEEDLGFLGKVEQSTVGRAGDPVNQAFLIGGGIIALMSTLAVWGLLVIGVVLRYVTGGSLEYATELPSYLYPWIIAGGVIVAMAIGGHIAVDFVLSRFRGRAQDMAQAVVWAAGGALFLLFTVLSYELVAPMTSQVTPVLGWPRIGSFAAILVMSGALSVQSFARSFYALRCGAPQEGGVIGV